MPAELRQPRPLKANVRFFRTAAEAQAAGFRPCKTCKPSTTACSSPLDKIRIHIEANLDRPVRLEELGRVAGLSPFTVQRLFKREMGVSPLAYQRALRAGSLRKALKQGDTVTNAIYEAGFGSSSRAYEGAQLGMTPARFAKGGKGEKIGWTTARSPFGWVDCGSDGARPVLACAGGDLSRSRSQLARGVSRRPSCGAIRRSRRWWMRRWRACRQRQDPSKARPRRERWICAEPYFNCACGRRCAKIPRGETRTYSQLAREMGQPNATRAVARACASNRVSVLVPCHRVVGASGSLTGYRWGVERKRQLLEAEGARS